MYNISMTFNGQGAAHRFCSVFNPSGSGMEVLIGEACVIPYASTSASSDTPFLLSRITTATGGTLQAASVINKCMTTYPDSVAEVRTVNPTVTAGARIFSFSPPSQGLTAVAFAPAQQIFHPMDHIHLMPGEGVSFLQEAGGDTDHKYNAYLYWMEQPML